MPYRMGGWGIPNPFKGGVPNIPDPIEHLWGSSAIGSGTDNLMNLLKGLSGGGGGGGDSYQWHPMGGNMASGLLENALAGAGVGAVRGAQGKKKKRGDYLTPDQELLAQLNALMDQNMGGLGPEQLQAALSEAAGGIKQAYGAQIGSVRHQMAGARKDTRQGSKEIRKMYAALARDYRKGAKREQRQGAKDAKVLQNLGERQADQIGAGTAKAMDQLAAISGGLGAPSIMEAVAPGIEKQGGDLARQARNEGTRSGTAQAELSGTERRYINAQAGNSMLEGTNRSADLYSQLEDYLQANRDKISEIAGQRAQALAAAKSQIQGDFSKAQSDQLQQLIENKMNLAQLRRQMQNDAWDQKMDLSKLSQGGGQAGDPYKLFADQSAGPMRLLSQLNDPTVSKLYNSFSDNNSMMSGYYDNNGDPNNRVPLQNNYAGMLDYVQERMGAGWNQLSAAQRTALINALLLQLQGGNFRMPN